MNKLEEPTSVTNNKKQRETKNREYGEFEKVFREERKKLKNENASRKEVQN